MSKILFVPLTTWNQRTGAHASRQLYIAFYYIRSVVTSVVAFAEIVTATASQNSIPSEQNSYLSFSQNQFGLGYRVTRFAFELGFR